MGRIQIVRWRGRAHFSKGGCPTSRAFREVGSVVMRLRDARGSALLEFAIMLPLLMVFIVGIYDFSGAFNQKQKIEQAAEEGAIVAGAQPTNDIQTSNGNPDSLQPVATAIVNSLIASGVVATGCTPGAGSGGANLTWTYTPSCPDPLIITINRGLVTGPGSPGSGSPATLSTIVTITYPYHWRFGSVIQLLFPGPNGYLTPTQLKGTATVHNQI
jgi:Flp pilus assembly protein TadG